MNTCAKIIAIGLVQGVGFRWFVQREATKLNLTGYVKNVYNGDVEIVAEGERGLIEELIKIMKIGNRLSRVSYLHIEWINAQNKYSAFDIRY